MMVILIIIFIVVCVVCVAILGVSNKPKCDHEWKCVHRIQHYIYDEPWDKYPSEKYMENIWECEKCGEIRKTYYDL